MDGIIKRGPYCNVGPGFIIQQVQLYTEPVSLKYGKLAQNISGYTDIFYSARKRKMAISFRLARLAAIHCNAGSSGNCWPNVQIGLT